MIYGEKKPAIREIIFALEEERQWMELVREDWKPYSKLIDFLLSEPVYNEESDPEIVKNMTVTSYSARFGEKQSTINKWLRQIYADIFDLNQKHPELFAKPGEQMCMLYYRSRWEKTGFIFYLGLRIIPRVGEEFVFYFPKAVTDSSSLIVKEVSHRYECGSMVIDIKLDSEYFNGSSYRNLLIEKALFLHFISFEDIYLPDYVLDRKLKKVFGCRKPEYI